MPKRFERLFSPNKSATQTAGIYKDVIRELTETACPVDVLAAAMIVPQVVVLLGMDESAESKVSRFQRLYKNGNDAQAIMTIYKDVVAELTRSGTCPIPHEAVPMIVAQVIHAVGRPETVISEGVPIGQAIHISYGGSGTPDPDKLTPEEVPDGLRPQAKPEPVAEGKKGTP